MSEAAVILGHSILGIAKGTAQFLPNGIANPREGMWIDEIRFLTSMKFSEADAATSAKTILHDAIRFYCKVGKTELTKGYVGMPLAAGVRDWEVEVGLGLGDSAEPGYYNAYGVGAFCWRLPKPMFLPRNGVLDIGVQYQDDLDFPAKTLNVDIAVLGRPVASGAEPKTVDVPYVAAWYGDVLTNPGANTNPASAGTPVTVVNKADQQSTTADLRNGFHVPLRVTRFAATQWANGPFSSTAGLTAQQSGPEIFAWVGGSAALVPALNSNSGQDSPVFEPTTMRILDHLGQPVARDRVSPGELMAYADRAWRVDALLPANGYYMVDATTILTSPFKSTRLAVGMVGYRTIPLGDLGVAP